MIDDPPLLTIRRRYNRPTSEHLSFLKNVATVAIVDALGGRAALASTIKPFSETIAICGTVLTCYAGPADNLAAYGALTIAHPGDVVVCATDGYTGTAVAGDLLLGMMRNRGIAGFVTDGCVRDIGGIRKVGMPCFAAGLTPNSPSHNGPGTVGLPIVIAGISIESGDVIAADEDGIVIIPQARIDDVIMRVPSIQVAEARLVAEVSAGLEIPNFLRMMLDAGDFREIE